MSDRSRPGSGEPDPPPPDPTAGPSRRDFLTSGSGLTMAAGLTAGYGTLGLMAARYTYPARDRLKAWVYVIDAAALKEGDSLTYRAPGGETIAIARQGATGKIEDFLALSSTCPHLGCQVHWEGPANRFFCPCHNGAFDPTGKPIEGPPADSGTPLSGYQLKLENGLLFIQVPIETLKADARGRVLDRPERSRPGHDPCLSPRRDRWEV